MYELYKYQNARKNDKKVSSYIHIFHLSIPEVIYQTVIDNRMRSDESVTSVSLWHCVQFLFTLLYFRFSSTFFEQCAFPCILWVFFVWLACYGTHSQTCLKWQTVRNPLDLAVKLCYIEFQASWQSCGNMAWKEGVSADHVTDWTGEQCSFIDYVLTTVTVTDGAGLK